MAAALRGYKVHRRDARQDEQGEDRHRCALSAPRSSSARPRSSPIPRSPTTGADRLTEEIPARSSRTSTSTPPTPRPTTPPRARALAPERGQITHLVDRASAPAGRITGVGRYLKEQNPGIEVIGADPEGSIYSGGPGPPLPRRGRSARTSGPTACDRDVVDRYVIGHRSRLVPDGPPRWSRAEGLFAVGSTGHRPVRAPSQVARELDDPDAMVATILPDGGRALRLEGLQRLVDARARLPARRRGALTVGEVLAARRGRRPAADRRQPRRRAARAGADARARRLAGAGGLRARTSGRSSARSASAAC